MSKITSEAIAAELQAQAPQDPGITEAPAPELADPITLEELDALDLDTVGTPEERPPFRIADDGCADWAIRKIAEERKEYDRIKELGERQIAEIQEKIEAAKRRYENGTSFLTGHLASYFQTVPHKKTKTTAKYRLLSGTLTMKLGQPKAVPDDKKLLEWLKANGHDDMVKVEEKPTWGELKKKLVLSGSVVTIADTGEIVEGVTVVQPPDTFTVDL